jgi:hypothetical protein
MRVIRFLKSVPPYNSGDTAGFSDTEAAQYLAMPGVAEDPGIPYKGPSRSAELDPYPQGKPLPERTTAGKPAKDPNPGKD